MCKEKREKNIITEIRDLIWSEIFNGIIKTLKLEDEEEKREKQNLKERIQMGLIYTEKVREQKEREERNKLKERIKKMIIAEEDEIRKEQLEKLRKKIKAVEEKKEKVGDEEKEITIINEKKWETLSKRDVEEIIKQQIQLRKETWEQIIGKIIKHLGEITSIEDEKGNKTKREKEENKLKKK